MKARHEFADEPAPAPALEHSIPDAESLAKREYKHGFVTDIASEKAPKGLDESTVRYISAKKGEPEWMLEYRLRAYRRFLTLQEPTWSGLRYPAPNFQDMYFYSEPKTKAKLGSLDEADPKLLETYRKLGVPLHEQKILAGVAVDAVFDSVSVGTTYKEELKRHGVIFMPLSEALREHSDLVRRYFGTVVPYTDNYYACLNAAVFTEGSFVYVPEGVTCPMELSTYFRINEANTGQFERTLIVVEKGASVSYLEGCTAPMRDEHQLHAAVVELTAMEDARIKYSTVQNWYPGDEEGKGGVFNFVTKRGICKGDRSRISWTQLETGSAVTWKYPSCILKGDGSSGEFYSVAVTNGAQQADTGTKMIHLGKNTTSSIVSKGISAGKSRNVYRGLVSIRPGALGARNHTRCDSLLIGGTCAAAAVPYIESGEPTAKVEHEATVSKISDEQLFYCLQRGMNEEDAVSMIVSGFCKEALSELPLEFAAEASALLKVSLEGATG